MGRFKGINREFIEAISAPAALAEDLQSPRLAYAPIEKSANDELRYTFGVFYAPDALDAHDEYATEDDLRKALWDFSLNGDRSLRKQHGFEKVGDIVELVQWPFEQKVELTVPGTEVTKSVTLPAGTIYAGTRWTPGAWEDVKKGKLTGYSMGGTAVRLHDASDGNALTKFE